jgi:hypothetical protein
MNNIKNKITLSNKIFNKNIYAKHIFRYRKDKRIFVIDSDFNYSNISFKKKRKVKKRVRGTSVFLNRYDFKHKYFKEMQLQTFLPFIQIKSQYENASNLIKDLNLINNCTLQILKPIKGGFFVRHRNIGGFLPKSHFKLIVKERRKSLLNLKTLPSKMYLSNLHSLNSLLTPRFSFKMGRCSMRPYYQKNNFVSYWRKRTYRPKLSLVFISDKSQNVNSNKISSINLNKNLLFKKDKDPSINLKNKFLFKETKNQNTNLNKNLLFKKDKGPNINSYDKFSFKENKNSNKKPSAK